MSHYHHKHDRSRSHSRSSTNKREFPQNRNKGPPKDYDRRADFFERRHHAGEYFSIKLLKIFSVFIKHNQLDTILINLYLI